MGGYGSVFLKNLTKNLIFGKSSGEGDGGPKLVVECPSFKEGKSAINLSNLGNLAKFDPGLLIYVGQVGGVQFFFVRPVGGP